MEENLKQDEFYQGEVLILSSSSDEDTAEVSAAANATFTPTTRLQREYSGWRDDSKPASNLVPRRKV